MFGRRGCCRCHRKRTEKDCEGKRNLSHREQYLKSSMLVRPRRREAAGYIRPPIGSAQSMLCATASSRSASVRPRRPMAAATPSRLATADWYDKLIQSEQSGDGLNEKCIRFVWSGSVVAYCNGRADGFSRHA